MCWLCQKSDIGVTARYNKCLLFHAPCLRAVKARHRKLRQNSVAEISDTMINLDKTEMAANPLKWRPRVLPYLDNDKTGKASVRNLHLRMLRISQRSRERLVQWSMTMM